jgi:23S rRNA (uracil1939-C5)-methyltransferase
MPNNVNVIKGKAVDYTHDGRGVVKTDGQLIFVDGLMLGETADIRIESQKKSFKTGSVLALHTTSSDRIKPPCPYFETCGGCQLQHMTYTHQLTMKKKRVEDALKHIAKIYTKVSDVIPSEMPFRYRNKIQMAFSNSKEGLISGFYQAKTRRVTPIASCLIEHEEGNQVISALTKILHSYHIKAYDETTKTGSIKHAIVKKALHTKGLMLIIITHTHELKKSDQIVSELLKKHPMIETIIHQVNQDTYKVMGNKDTILYGKGYIEDYLGTLKFRIKPQSFYQVNPHQTLNLYKQAIKMAGITKQDTVLDAYSGVGTISLFAAQYAKKVYGVEIVSDAVLDARFNANENNIHNVEFICEDAKTFMIKHKQSLNIDVLIVDPPRDGLHEEFINAVKVMKPKKMVYVSCEPSSLARDLKLLKSMYDIKDVVPVDMFSQTYHVETVALLSLKTS